MFATLRNRDDLIKEQLRGYEKLEEHVKINMKNFCLKDITGEVCFNLYRELDPKIKIEKALTR